MSLEILSQKAVKAALDGDWEQAVFFNQEILKLDKDNINALNRLAKAYIEQKRGDEAKKFLNKVLKLEPSNEIAKKNLKRVNKFSHTEGITSPGSFIKEPGKTKTIVVESQLSPREIIHLEPGEKLKLKPYHKKVKVLDLGGHEVAQLEEKEAKLLLKILKKKTPLSVNLISIDGKKLFILIKAAIEIFPPEKKPPQYRSYVTRPRREEIPYEAEEED